MAVPTLTSRGVPSGARITDGYQTLMAFQANATVSFWEISVTPPGIDGGEAVENTTMLNTTWRTMAARALKTMTPAQMTAAYDSAVYDNIVALINVETSITIHFPDSSALVFYGFLQKFEPGELKEGTQPTATITVVPTNYDPVNGVEAAPVYDSNGSGAGT